MYVTSEKLICLPHRAIFQNYKKTSMQCGQNTCTANYKGRNKNDQTRSCTGEERGEYNKILLFTYHVDKWDMCRPLVGVGVGPTLQGSFDKLNLNFATWSPGNQAWPWILGIPSGDIFKPSEKGLGLWIREELHVVCSMCLLVRPGACGASLGRDEAYSQWCAQALAKGTSRN